MLIAHLQHIGLCSQRQNDALFDGRTVHQSEFILSERKVILDNLSVAIADGAGANHIAGVVSKFTLECFSEYLKKQTTYSSRLIREVHGDLCNRYAKGRTKGAATTIVSAKLSNHQCQILNVGDSRAYKISHADRWTQLSFDHTVINRLRDEGVAQEDVEYASFYHALDDCLIADHESSDFSIHQHTTSLVNGDYIFLCSDGVHNFVSEQSIKSAFDQTITPAKQLEVWADLVLKKRAPDNFSMILVKLIT